MFKYQIGEKEMHCFYNFKWIDVYICTIIVYCINLEFCNFSISKTPFTFLPSIFYNFFLSRSAYFSNEFYTSLAIEVFINSFACPVLHYLTSNVSQRRIQSLRKISVHTSFVKSRDTIVGILSRAAVFF